LLYSWINNLGVAWCGQTAYAAISFKGKDGSGLHLHTSLPSLEVSLSNQHYRDIMGFVAGNLAEKDVFSDPPPPVQRKQKTAYNANPVFSPPSGAVAGIRISAYVTRVQIILRAPESNWTKSVGSRPPGASSSSRAPPSEEVTHRTEIPVAFALLTLDNVIFNLGMLAGGNMHLDVASGYVDVDDLRFSESGKTSHLGRSTSLGMRAPPVSRHQAAEHTPVIHMKPVLVRGCPVFDTAQVPVVAVITAPATVPDEERAHINDDQVRAPACRESKAEGVSIWLRV
jgi:hypothetical protein